ncbi:ribosome silencing factor [Geobacter sp.]|uniref:ribosome silencing factor n=1 Tax=Geobacter sp. TaxID=46610 RepID=UPI0026183CD9|nr:ribosome silencing factor [Geobacter sp.]
MPDKPTLTPQERALQCARFALDKKALDVKVLEIRRLTTIADYLVLATGRSDKQAQAIAESVKKGLKPYGKALDVEGLNEGNWIVIDYGDVIVHVFREELRGYYDLDELWSEAPRLEIPAEYLWEDKEGHGE